jgi:phospholipid/cholesterol/gamma-HCH transport system ATP-binding protein
MGGSGSGKYTLLPACRMGSRAANGQAAGTISATPASAMLAIRRQIGVSFQGGALLTSMSVAAQRRAAVARAHG